MVWLFVQSDILGFSQTTKQQFGELEQINKYDNN